MSARIAPAVLRARDQLGDRAQHLLVADRALDGELDLVRHLLGERAVAGLELGQARRRTARTRRAGSGSASAASTSSSSDSYIAPSDRLDERLLGGEVAAHRADAHAGPPRDLLDLGLHARLREHRLGRGEHPLAVAAGVGAGGGPLARLGPAACQAES